MLSTVFISYSHQDRRWKNLLVRQLGVLESEGLLATWHDGLIQPGADWLPSIEHAMAAARTAVFLVSADFLSSEFVRRKEIPPLMERRRTEGLRVIPLIARPCPWQKVPWLAAIQARPLDGKSLAELGGVKAEKVLSDLAHEILTLLELAANPNPPFVRIVLPTPVQARAPAPTALSLPHGTTHRRADSARSGPGRTHRSPGGAAIRQLAHTRGSQNRTIQVQPPTTESPLLEAAAARQAADSIRGYRYQIWRSVLAWLDLGDRELRIPAKATTHSDGRRPPVGARR